ncbi:hypothetical protein Tco_1466802 [Tanacetum coccineum]
MSTLSQFAFACNSIVLKEVLAVMFENDNEHDFNLVIDMHTKLNDLGMRIRQRAELILDVEKQGYAAEVFETVKLLKDLQETDNAKARQLIWWNRDLEIIPRGLAWLRKKLFKRSDYSLLFGKVNLDLTPTISEQQTFWYMAFRKFYMSYIPRSPPTTYTDLFDDYMKKLSSSRKRGKIDTRDLPIIRRCDTTSVEEIRLKDGVIAKLNSRVFKLEAIIKVLGRERKGDKSCVAEFFHNFSSGCWEELNEEFKELCQTKFCVNRPAMIDLDSDEDLVKEVQRRDEKEKMLKYEEEKKKRRHKLMNTDHWKLFVSKISNGKRTQRSSAFSAYYWGNTFAMAEKDRPLNTLNDQDMNLFLKDVSVGRRFWESLVCLDPTKKGWIMDEHVELWVNYM